MTQAPTRPNAGGESGPTCKPSAAGPACAGSGICWFRVLLFLAVIALFVLTAALNARAADAARGQRLAQDHCAACHAVAPQMRSEVADAPPFETIAGKYGHDADRIAHAIAGPHPKMNFSPAPAAAADIAAYIATLRQ
jgi:mono/diheme cytochrome c family protein